MVASQPRIEDRGSDWHRRHSDHLDHCFFGSDPDLDRTQPYLDQVGPDSDRTKSEHESERSGLGSSWSLTVMTIRSRRGGKAYLTLRSRRVTRTALDG